MTWEAVKRWALAPVRLLWLAILAASVGLAVWKLKRAERGTQEARQRYEDLFDQGRQDVVGEVRDAVQRHQSAQDRAQEARRKAEARVDELAKGDDSLRDLLDRWNSDRVRDEHDPT